MSDKNVTADQCLRIECPGEIFLQRVEENLVIFRCSGEQRHGRMKFQVVWIAKDLLDRFVVDLQNKPGAFS